MLGGMNMNDTKKKNISIIFILLILLVFSFGLDFFRGRLPKPEVTTGQRGELGIDKHVNENCFLGIADAGKNLRKCLGTVA